jgi:SAM-dependent methyltransferase
MTDPTNPNAESFGAQWRSFDYERDRTWGSTPEQHFARFLADIGLSVEELRGLRVLDAGCGTGVLTGQIAAAGVETVGLDISSSVERAREVFPKATFVRGDVSAPPADIGQFDVIYSGGVLHHTPDTRQSLEALLPLLRPGGRIYIWLYQRLPGRMYATKMALRRGPLWWRRLIAAPFALQGWLRHRDRSMPLREYYVITHDFFTPRWRWEHTPEEVERWFHELGAAVVETRGVDRDGFGVLAVI